MTRRLVLCPLSLVCTLSLVCLVSYHAWPGPENASALAKEQPAARQVADGSAGDVTADCKKAQENPLPLPSSPEFTTAKLYTFLYTRQYAKQCTDGKPGLGWCRDKGLDKTIPVRDTGPWVRGTYYGSHPAVRIYYSPAVMYWLTGDPDYWPAGKSPGQAKKQPPRTGEIPDGAMIVKEMFNPPAARYEGFSESQLIDNLTSPKSSFGWTVMIRDKKASKDGWYWGGYYPTDRTPNPVSPYKDAQDEERETYHDPFNYQNSGFGQYCLRCHSAAEKELTFSSLRNVEGFPGDPLTFFVDATWRKLNPSEDPFSLNRADSKSIFNVSEHHRPHIHAQLRMRAVDAPTEFLKTYSQMKPISLDSVKKFPAETYDRVVAAPKVAEGFLSSDQCMSCHSGATGAYGPVMFLETGPTDSAGVAKGHNVSPYGEWRWSPMGVGGRDPIFHAQLETEVALLKKEFVGNPKELDKQITATQNTCLLCHGVMGKRQYDIDQKKPFYEADFNRFWIYATPDSTDPDLAKHAKYGGLARDGISCAACHRTTEKYQNLTEFLENSTTGHYTAGKPDSLIGPFSDDTISPYFMNTALGIKPRHDTYIQSSRLCGSCHTINLPIVDKAVGPNPTILDKIEKNPTFKPFSHSIEQSTYLEWLNSEFQNEVKPFGTNPKSCQDCHMPGGFHFDKISIDQLETKFAVVQDQTVPEAEHRAPTNDILVRFRTGKDKAKFRRHTLQGLNVFVAEMFRQFNDVLGVRTSDFMSGSNTDLDDAIAFFAQQAQEQTANLEITNFKVAGGVVEAEVTVTNKTGHKLPSGVGFRRLFIELLVLRTSAGRDEIIWQSGRTNTMGVILDGDGQVLGTEFHKPIKINGELRSYQPHWETITSQNQVQIYEELTQNAKGEFTYSFIHRDTEVKDNRLLARGWTPKGPDPSIPMAFIEPTHPTGNAAKDPEYQADPKIGYALGIDKVVYRVALPAGTDPANVRVKATLYSQSVSPAFLAEKFEDVPEGPDGWSRRRLFYLTSNLKTDKRPIQDWKLKLVTDVAPKAKL